MGCNQPIRRPDPQALDVSPCVPALLCAGRALFARSCYYAYGLDSYESAHTFTAQLAGYAAAVEILDAPDG